MKLFDPRHSIWYFKFVQSHPSVQSHPYHKLVGSVFSYYSYIYRSSILSFGCFAICKMQYCFIQPEFVVVKLYPHPLGLNTLKYSSMPLESNLVSKCLEFFFVCLEDKNLKMFLLCIVLILDVQAHSEIMKFAFSSLPLNQQSST